MPSVQVADDAAAGSDIPNLGQASAVVAKHVTSQREAKKSNTSFLKSHAKIPRSHPAGATVRKSQPPPHLSEPQCIHAGR